MTENKKLTINLNLLKEILTLQAPSREEEKVREYIINKIKNDLKITCHLEVDKEGNLLVTKGKASLYPCIVSHLDDVHKFNPNKTIFQQGDTLFAFDGEKQIGTAGDDKCGIYICLQALIDFKDIKVVFFVNEETGMTGSGEINLDFFKDCKFIGQPDRKGNSDLIHFTNGTTVMSDEFKEFLEPIIKDYDYSFCHGIATDVGKLTNRNVGISCFNISCGYYNAHSDREIVKISEVDKCYKLIKSIINRCDKQYIYNKPVYNYTKTYTSDFEDDDLVETVMDLYSKKNTKVVPQFKYGVRQGVKFVVELLKKCESSFGDKETYTLADEFEDYLTFIDEEHDCVTKAIPFYNNLTNKHEYNCKICKKDVTDQVNTIGSIEGQTYIFDEMN